MKYKTLGYTGLFSLHIEPPSYNYLYSCFIPIQQKKVAHVMPRLTCYMHACVHVVLIILI